MVSGYSKISFFMLEKLVQIDHTMNMMDVVGTWLSEGFSSLLIKNTFINHIFRATENLMKVKYKFQSHFLFLIYGI